MSRTLILISILFLTSCHTKDKGEDQSPVNATSDAASIDSAQEVSAALAFLNSYVANCNKMKTRADVGVVKWTNASPLASQHLKIELKRLDDEAWKKEPIVGLDADPIFEARYFPEKGFILDSVDRVDHYLYVKGVDIPQFKLCVKMAKVNGRWLVDGCGIINIPKDKRLVR